MSKYLDAALYKLLAITAVLATLGCGASSGKAPASPVTKAQSDGGWSSGGGELLKDSHNPWFLKKREKVSYCIRVESGATNLSEIEIQKTFEAATKFWRSEFSAAILPDYLENDRVTLGKQDFVRVSCAADPALEIRFGPLTLGEARKLGSSSEYAAITLRTSYDRQKLVGKGLIVFTPQMHDVNGLAMPVDLWSHQSSLSLYLAMVHELGHVYGIPHLGNRGELMSESFVEDVLRSARENSLMKEDRHFFTFTKGGQRRCPEGLGAEILKSRWKEAFNLSADFACLRFQFAHEASNEILGRSLLKVFESASPTAREDLVATAELSLSSYFPYFTNQMWITPEQEFFPFEERSQYQPPYLFLFGLYSVSKTGSFELRRDAQKRALRVLFTQGAYNYSVETVIDNQIVSIF